MVWIVPAWIAITFFQYNFMVKPEVFLVYYFLGTVIFTTFWMSPHATELIPTGYAIALMIGVGIFSGGPANILLFRAVSIAPNQGLPVAIATTSSIIVFAASFWLGQLLPSYFPRLTFNIYHLVGMLLAVAAVMVFSLAPSK